MNNVGKERKKIELADVIIISAIIVAIIIAIIGTIIWVRYNHSKEQKKEQSTYTTIPNNEKYKYKIDNNKISFYNGKKEVDTYTCISDCSIRKTAVDQFIIDYDAFIPIYDNNKYIIYNIDIKSTYYTFDTYPEKTLNENIGIITKNNKKGAIKRNGGLVLNTDFDDIEVTNNYMVTLQNGIVNIYNSSNVKLTNNEIINMYEVMPLEKDNKLYLYLTDLNGSKTVLEYNPIARTFN